jgi:hypothetical protein
MKVSFVRNPLKKYVCDNCGTQFNWDKNSLRYGKAEYKTITEQKKDEKYYCSKRCTENLKD